MDAAELHNALREIPGASDLSTEMVARLASLAEWRRDPAGTVLFREGEHHAAYYIVHQGHVALEMCLSGRGCTRLLTLGPGEIVAWSSLLGSGVMTATGIAQDDVELIEFSGPRVRQLCDADQQLGYRVMRWLAAALSQRLLATRLQLLDLFTSDAPFPSGGTR